VGAMTVVAIDWVQLWFGAKFIGNAVMIVFALLFLAYAVRKGTE